MHRQQNIKKVTAQFFSCYADSKHLIYQDCVIEFFNPCPAFNVFYQTEEIVPSMNVQSRKLFPC